MSRAVLLIHGFVTDYHDFDPLYPALNEIYDCVFPVELPGHTDLDFKKFNAIDTFKCVLDSFDRLNEKYDSIDVIGYSMGGALATYLSNNREFNNLVLLAPANKYFNLSFVFKKAGFYVKHIFQKIVRRRLTNEEEKMVESILIDDENSITLAIHRLLPNYTFKTIKTFIKIINKCNEELREIKNKTLIIWGKYDQLVPKSSIDYNIEKCTHKESKVIIYEALSHLMLASSENKDIIEKVVEFLK